MKTVILGCIVAAVVWAAPAGTASAGKEIYDKTCKTCHGADGGGNPAIAKMMKVELHPLGSKDVQGKTDEELKKIISQGTGKMKPVAGVSGKQIDDVVAYVRSLKK
jgi:mono/diheme cytochrome c family protein